MRILFLLPEFPCPPTTGGQLKVMTILTALSTRHQCDVLSIGNFDVDRVRVLERLLPQVRVLGVIPADRNWVRVIGKINEILKGGVPSFAGYYSREYQQLLMKVVANNTYDAIHFDVINMTQYHKWVSGIPSIHSANDATSMVYFQFARQATTLLKKIKYYASAYMLRRFEKNFYNLFNKVHVVTQIDADYLKKLSSLINVEAIPIAVDDSYLRVQSLSQFEPNAGFTIICTGNLANAAIAKGVIDFLKIGLPLVARQWPKVRFVMLGQNAVKTQLDKFNAAGRAELLTWVDNYRDFLALGDVFLVPDQFGPPGVKTRTLQAMGVGLPVVGTSTAFAGIPCVHGVHGMHYLTPEEAAKEICLLFGDHSLRKMLGASAHKLVNDAFSMRVIGPQYVKMYRLVGARNV